jgi:hypothetical protein
VHITSWLGSLKGGDHWEDLGVDGYNINMDLRELRFGDVDWIHLAQDWDSWRALVNMVMSLRIL